MYVSMFYSCLPLLLFVCWLSVSQSYMYKYTNLFDPSQDIFRVYLFQFGIMLNCALNRVFSCPCLPSYPFICVFRHVLDIFAPYLYKHIPKHQNGLKSALKCKSTQFKQTINNLLTNCKLFVNCVNHPLTNKNFILYGAKFPIYIQINGGQTCFYLVEGSTPHILLYMMT